MSIYFYRIFGKYSNYLDSHPLTSRLISAQIIYVAGDVFAQKYFLKNDHVNWQRTFCGAFLATGVAFGVHKYIQFIHHFMESGRLISASAPKYKKVLLSVLGDQIFISPSINLFFLAGITFMLEQNLEAVKQNVQDRFIDTQLLAYRFWPFALLINFAFVPLKFRMLFQNISGFMWNSMRSYITFKKIDVSQLPDDKFINQQLVMG
ncbi:hypothetical protein PPERSA_08106 [Pseudocohnilembus persalinus]|uniref:Mpv17/PMP22 n=1 Tax=Pseudocohnilembus persalinus TaxID=266149 RepID=A0A0V0QLJ9_PSEPJ|nr:hypothetical protein PPERSA_08106 [Pseudocohnilembus persalinus]|eukprot:KRX03031.1 hypothetical protein PPERSA_08106 [Pseudocohnilembus persalinus]